MGKIATFVLCTLLGMTLGVSGSTAQAAGSVHLLTTPSQGHPGDLVDLSGMGFRPNRPVSIAARCGSRSMGFGKVVANGRGAFAGKLLRLTAAGSHTSGCTFTARSRSGGPVVRSQRYRLVSATRPLPRCATRMCIKVQAFLVRLKNGAQGNIVLSGWPGASVDVTVARVERGAKYRHVTLNWKGAGAAKMFVAPGLLKGIRARVFVRARLGSLSARAVSPFHVLFGNR